MKILHITSQKPYDTGSGIYLKNLITEFNKKRYSQALICGIEESDSLLEYKDFAELYPVYFKTREIPFEVIGMSDVMPYRSKRYSDLTELEFNIWEKEFKKQCIKAIENFEPDIIISNHLWISTAIVRDLVKDIPIVGICHGTCLRQLNKTKFKNEYIKRHIKSIDYAFVLHEEQKHMVEAEYNIPLRRIRVIGSGYDANIFNKKNMKKESLNKVKIIYAGKVSESKGVPSLIRAFERLCNDSDLKFELFIAGSGSGNEYDNILKMVENKKDIRLLGKLDQKELSEYFRNSDIFVLPSFYEGLPLVIVEALACGCKVITTNTMGVKKYIGDEINNSNNIIYLDLPTINNQDIPNKEELYDFETRILKSIEIMALKSTNKIPQICFEKFTWKNVIDLIQIEKLYTNAL